MAGDEKLNRRLSKNFMTTVFGANMMPFEVNRRDIRYCNYSKSQFYTLEKLKKKMFKIGIRKRMVLANQHTHHAHRLVFAYRNKFLNFFKVL